MAATKGNWHPKTGSAPMDFSREVRKDILKQPLRLIHGTRSGLDKTSRRASAKIIITLGIRKGRQPLARAFGYFSRAGKVTRGL